MIIKRGFISPLSFLYYPGANTKPIYYTTFTELAGRQTLMGDRGAFWGNVAIAGSYAYQSDYIASVDPYDMGKTYGAPRRNLVGDYYNDSTNCGSRSMHCNTYPYTVASSTAARGCNKRRNLHLFEYYPGYSSGDQEHIYYPAYTNWPIYRGTVDPQSYGGTNGLPRRVFVGGEYTSSTNNGSRDIACDSYTSRAYISAAARGCNKATHLPNQSVWSTSVHIDQPTSWIQSNQLGQLGKI